MNRNLKIIIALMICVLLVVGCYNKRIVWSPDGKWGAICSNDGLYFTDSDGKVSRIMHPDVYRAEWFADSQHLVIGEGAHAYNWGQVDKIISDEDREKYMMHVKFLRDVSTPTEWKAKTKALLENGILAKDELTAVQMFLRDRQGRPFSGSVLKSWNKELIFYYHFIRVGIWDGKKFTVQKTLWSSSQRVWDMRTSKLGRAVAFTSAFPDRTPGDEDERQVSSLWVADRLTGKTVLLDQDVALYPGWSADGRSPVYVRSIGDSNAGSAIGTLLQTRICDEQGMLLDHFSEPKSLAGLVANEYTKVRCLSDGRIIFSSIELNLPVIGKDAPEYNQLFVLDPQKQAMITRLIPQRTLNDSLGYNFDFFEVSPDESMISVLDDEGRTAVLTIATGQFTELQRDELGDEVVVPTWRYPDELCYVAPIPEGENKTRQIVLRQVGSDGAWGRPRPISDKWPDEARAGWLD